MENEVTQPKNKTEKFIGFMEKLKPQMALALPKHLNADRMCRLAVTSFSTNQKLQECSPISIAASMMTAVQLGLEPGVNGAGYLVPYNGVCTFVPGWKGLTDLVARSGRGTVYTGVIYSDQRYTFKDGAKRDLEIHNETDLDEESEITHAYAIGWVVDAALPIIELWNVRKIAKHRDKYNKQGSRHYSYKYWEMYARKVVLLQVLKYMPCSVEVANAIQVIDATEHGLSASIKDGIVIDHEESTEEPTKPPIKSPPKLPEMKPEQWVEKSVEWYGYFTDGLQSQEDIISSAQTKFTLTEEQISEIKSWENTKK